MNQVDITVTSKIVNYNNQPRLFVNNKPIIADAYLTYIDEKGDYESITEDGFKVYSVSIFSHSRIINENTKLEPFSTGVLDETKNINVINSKIERITSKNPNAYIIPRINIELSRLWEENNVDELNDNYVRFGDKRVCYSSEKWISKVKEELKIIINYIQNQSFAKNIIGYQIAGGMTEEWMAFDNNGCQGKRSRELFTKKVNEGIYENTEIEYRKFLNDQAVNVICELAAYTKELTSNRLIVGTFYGYSYALTSWHFCHSSLSKLLECKDIDFISAPLAYWTGREVGEPCPYMVPVASIRAHNKMYFAENDCRTHLSTFFSTNPSYHTPIWKGPNEEYSLEMLKYFYGKALTHQTSYWWFDLWGGWYKNEVYHALFKKLLSISNESLSQCNESLKQVAVITDEKDAFYENAILGNAEVKRDPLRNIEKSGVSFDLYLSSDFNLINDKYSCFIILYNHLTKDIENIISYLNAHNCKYLIINQNNKNITSDEIRAFYKNSGLKTYDIDLVVDENNNYLSIYGIKTGKIVLDQKLFDFLNHKEIRNELNIEKGKTYLFKKF